MRRFVLAGLPFVVGVVLNCTAPSINGLIFACATDADCAGGKVCGPVNGALGCITRPLPEAGPDAPVGGDIRIGMSAAFSGTSGDLGTEMRRGINAYFKKANDTGGVMGGRKLVLDALDDQYQPAPAVLNTEKLLDLPQTPLLDDGGAPSTPERAGPNSVFAILGNVGTPTMVVTFPIITGAHTIFFAPFTGSQKYLRDGTNSPYSFNFRAGYYDETEAMLDYFFIKRLPAIPDWGHIIVFAQNDSYGDAGYNGIVNAYTSSGHQPALPTKTSITRINYTRDDLNSVDTAFAQITAKPPDGGTLNGYNLETLFEDSLNNLGGKAQPIAIVMVDTYKIGAKFIKLVKDYINQDANHATILDVTFIHVSFVGPDSLASALQSAGTYTSVNGGTKAYSDGVMVTQVVPSYNAQSSGVVDYRDDIKAFDQGTYSSTSLEGYLASKLFVQGLQQTPTLTSDALVQTFEKLSSVDLGIGAIVGFSPTNHQASHFVWLSQLDATASYSFPFKWDPTNKIQPN